MIQKEKNGQFFFYESVSLAQSKTGIKLPVEVEYYIVNLLSDQINPRHALANVCLFDLLKEATESGPTDQIQRYRRLGDAAVITIGFNANGAYKLVSEDYCLFMGQVGYSNAGSLTHKYLGDRHFSDFYRLLNCVLSDCAQVVKTALGACLAPNKVV